MNLNRDETIDFMNNNEFSFVDKLIKLTIYEINMKEINVIKSMLRVVAFSHFKEIKDINFLFKLSVKKEQILDFATLCFIEQKENIIFLGTSGVRKTDLATSIGIATAKNEQILIL